MSDGFWSTAISAFLGFTAGVSIEFWKSGRADVQDLCKDFCNAVGEASDAGAEFWLTPATDTHSTFLLARVRGYQGRLDGYATILDSRLDSEMLDEIEFKLAEFFQNLTGGDPDPDDPGRQPAKERAFQLHGAASAVILAIRRAAYSRMSFGQRVSRWCSRSWVNQPRTMKLPPENPFRQR